jgi:NDP-sugar pyrophosphorylase family protein
MSGEMVARTVDELSGQAANCLEKLQAVVLLAGSVRSTRLREAIGRSMLDLPIGDGRTLLHYWQAQTSALAKVVGLKRLQVRVMVDREAQEPAAPAAQDGVILSVERDPMDFRGTGGVLKDLAKGYGPDDYILVANAHQLLLQDLSKLVRKVASKDGDVTVTSHHDGSVSSLMLVRCGVLERVADAGFVDMKEQALPLIARHHRVEVVDLKHPSGMPIRATADYVNSLRRHHRRATGAGETLSPWAEDWAPTFSIVEDGALVGAGARIHDSVVLKGARVETGAVVVRSVVCPGAVVGKGVLVAEELVEGRARGSKV